MRLRLNRKQKAYLKGHWGETKASFLLMLKGYHILEKRYKTPFGEIDLLARKGNTLVAVEVKSRHSLDEAALTLTSHQQKRIEKALSYYLMGKSNLFNQRFDVILIAPWTFPYHIKGAWFS